MSTTNGPMKTFRVTDKDGNVYVMTLVDTEARQSIDDAKNLEFDEQYFTSEVSQDEKTVNVGLNGVPLGVDSDSPLQIVQDTPQGIVFGSSAPFSTSIAPEYSSSSTYTAGSRCMYKGKYYSCYSDINPAEDWNPDHWGEITVDSLIGVLKNGGSKAQSSGAVDVPNNALTVITGVDVAALQVSVSFGMGSTEVPNFAVEISPTVDCTLTLKKYIGTSPLTLIPSVAGGNVMTAGKYYQVTCVGSYWTLAEFAMPNP